MFNILWIRLLYESKLILLECISLCILENVLGIKEFLIDDIGSEEILTDDENFGRGESTGQWLVSLNFSEELIHNPDERIVVVGSENLCNESTSLFKEIAGEFQGTQTQVNLDIGVLIPVGTDIGCTIIEYDINFGVPEFIF